MASTTPYPNLSSPARKINTPASPGAAVRPEDQKDSPEYKKRSAITAGPVLDMTYDNSAGYGMDESLFTSLRDIFEAIIGHQSRIGVVSPHRFLEILRRDNEMFRSAMHQDAHEFLNLLLNQVVDNVEMFAKQHPKPSGQIQANGVESDEHATNGTVTFSSGLKLPTSPLDTHWVHDLFEGLLTSETRCLTCENTSQRDEAFLDLSVDLSAHTSVTSCLRKFSEEEMLCERNKFHCDNCGGLQEAEKRMKIKRLPRILALHLKRFKYTEDLQRLQKLFHRVVYPFHLRLFNTTDDAQDPDRLYELYAVVVHIGGGPYHGHYVSIIKTQDRGWLLFDDELVEPVDQSYVLNFFGGEPVPGLQDAKQLACAYVLFYQETTLEAMIKEQQGMEAQQASAPVPNMEPSKNSFSSPIRNESIPARTAAITTPITEEPDHLEPLSKAVTVPEHPTAAATAPEQLQSKTITPVMPTKSKKELKQEEKERKAAQKVEQKALEEKRREASAKRMEAWKKADDELKQALEMSKASAAEEFKKRGEEPPREKEGGLSRFKFGSMNRRSRQKLQGDEKNGTKAGPPIPESNGAAETAETPTSTTPENGDTHKEPTAYLTALPPPPPVSSTMAEERSKKNRFSLGKKRSGVF